MSVSRAPDGNIALTEAASLDDAERLLGLLIDNPNAAVDWRACVACHTAVLQVLLAARRTMIGPPASDFLRRWIDLD
jgi:hypothetical protein